MSCVRSAGSFRLLDGVAGWEQEHVSGLVGLDDPKGLRLDARRVDPCVVHQSAVGRCLLPARLATDHRGTWYLATPRGVLSLAPCRDRFELVEVASFDAVDVRSIAAAGDLLAVGDVGRSRIRVLAGAARVVADIDVGPTRVPPSAVTITRFGQVVVAGGHEVLLVGVDGSISDRMCLPTTDPVVAIGPACLCAAEDARETTLLVVTDSGGGWQRVWAIDLVAHRVRPVEQAELECCAALRVPTTAEGFCVFRAVGGIERQRCFDWNGDPLDKPIDSFPPLEPFGQLVTEPLDSGVDGCHWQRVRVELDQPARPGALTVEVVTLTEVGEEPAAQDWHVLRDITDGLVQQPPGRYLRVRLSLRDVGGKTPVVRGVRLDFEQPSSIDRLPAIYREDSDAADFGARFLALFDSVINDIDAGIDRAIGRLDPLDPGLHDELLPALARLLGIAVDPAWPTDRLRRLLVHGAELASKSGTTRGLVELVDTLFGVTIFVEELGRSRPWGALRASRAGDRADEASGGLGVVRLSTRSRAAIRLGTSLLGRTPVDGAADPDHAPYRTGAHRVRVTVPPGLPLVEQRRLRELVTANLPATVAAEVRFAHPGFVVSHGVIVGVSTALVPLPAPVLRGDEDDRVVLGRAAVLARAPGGGATVTVGRCAAVGITTTVG